MDVLNVSIQQNQTTFQKRFKPRNVQKKLVDKLGCMVTERRYLENLKMTKEANPEIYVTQLRNSVDRNIFSMSNFECIKYLFKSLFSKVK